MAIRTGLVSRAALRLHARSDLRDKLGLGAVALVVGQAAAAISGQGVGETAELGGGQ